jgi:hypothetical protein
MGGGNNIFSQIQENGEVTHTRFLTYEDSLALHDNVINMMKMIFNYFMGGGEGYNIIINAVYSRGNYYAPAREFNSMLFATDYDLRALCMIYQSNANVYGLTGGINYENEEFHLTEIRVQNSIITLNLKNSGNHYEALIPSVEGGVNQQPVLDFSELLNRYSVKHPIYTGARRQEVWPEGEGMVLAEDNINITKINNLLSSNKVGRVSELKFSKPGFFQALATCIPSDSIGIEEKAILIQQNMKELCRLNLDCYTNRQFVKENYSDTTLDDANKITPDNFGLCDFVEKVHHKMAKLRHRDIRKCV